MLQTVLALVLFLIPLAYSPGPGNMFFAAIGARFGFRASIPANIGYHVATWGVTAAIGFGFLKVQGTLPRLFQTLQIAGALYVFWIAWKMLQASIVPEKGSIKPASFMSGVILLILNPKAYVIIALMFTQFLPDGADQTALILIITTVFTLNNCLAFVIWTLMGDYMTRLFHSSRSAQRLNIIFAVLLGAVALWMLYV